MGRGKVELKRIEDKGSRQVSFSKRRGGMMKKAHELSVLCDVDVGLFVFSGKNRLYEFSSGESMTKILTRYQDYKNADEIVRRNVHEKLPSEHKDVCTADELMQMIQRHLEEHKIKQANVTELSRLERDSESILRDVRSRKRELMFGSLKALQEKEKQLSIERQFMLREIMAAKLKEGNIAG